MASTTPAVNSATIISQISAIQFNPLAIQNVILVAGEQLANGSLRVVDPTNPFAMLMEATACICAAEIAESLATARKLYPSLAMTQEDLYRHMSDADYVNRFSTPGMGTFRLLLGVDEILAKAVAYTPWGLNNLTIGRHTSITVAGYTFTLQYPILINCLPNGSIQVFYDDTQKSDLQTLTSNKPNWGYTTGLNGNQFIYIDIPAYQMALISNTATVNSTKGLETTYTFSDTFFYCRAFIPDGSGGWTEIKTTHSDQTYDQAVPTVLLQVTPGQLNVKLPLIYVTNNLVTDQIRFDIYTTQGPISLQLNNYAPSAFSIAWLDLDAQTGVDAVTTNLQGTTGTPAYLDAYSSPLYSFNDITIYSDDLAFGGELAMTFPELRANVIDNSVGKPTEPITPYQLSNSLTDMGYVMTLAEDYITDRIYIASRPLPAPAPVTTSSSSSAQTAGTSVTPANAAIQTFQASIDLLKDVSTCYYNGSNRLVIKPTTVYQEIDSVISLVPEPLIAGMLPVGNLNYAASTPVMTPAGIVNNLNAANYLFTPFTYVLDTTAPSFELRPYYMLNPLINEKFYIDQNPSSEINVSIGEYAFSVNQDGTVYTLTLQTSSDSSFKNLFSNDDVFVQLQMSYIPPGSTERVYLVGVSLNAPNDIVNEQVYQFALTTDGDIDANHNLIMTCFQTSLNTTTIVPAAMATTFDVIFVVGNNSIVDPSTQIVPGITATTMDALIATYELPTGAWYDTSRQGVGILQEQIQVQFGNYLANFWQASRSVVSPAVYATYTADIPAYYTENVYIYDTTGNILLNIVDNNPTTPAPVHLLGDPILTTLGNASYQNAVTNGWTTGVVAWLASVVAANLVQYIVQPAANPPVLTLLGLASYNSAVAAGFVGSQGDWLNYTSMVYRRQFQVVQYQMGETKLDIDGNPIPAGTSTGSGMLRLCDMFFVDGKYLFATDVNTTSYFSSLISTIVDWTLVDMVVEQGDTLEMTMLYLYPSSTIGPINVIVGEGTMVQIASEQKLQVIYYMTAINQANETLKATLASTTVSILNTALQQTTISINDIQNQLALAAGGSILSVSVSGLGGDANNYQVMSIPNGSLQPSIAKQAVVLPDNTIAVQDAVNISFLKHMQA